MKVELEKYIPMVIPGFLYTFYVFGYDGDLVHFILTTLYYSTLLVISANLIISIVQIVSIKSITFAARLLTLRVKKWLGKLSFSKDQISDSTKDLNLVTSKLEKLASEKNREVMRYLINPDSLFIKSPTLYYLLLSVLVAISFDFYIYDGNRGYPNSVFFGIAAFIIISLFSVKQIFALLWNLKKTLDEFRNKNPVK